MTIVLISMISFKSNLKCTFIHIFCLCSSNSWEDLCGFHVFLFVLRALHNHLVQMVTSRSHEFKRQYIYSHLLGTISILSHLLGSHFCHYCTAAWKPWKCLTSTKIFIKKYFLKSDMYMYMFICFILLYHIKDFAVALQKYNFSVWIGPWKMLLWFLKICLCILHFEYVHWQCLNVFFSEFQVQSSYNYKKFYFISILAFTAGLLYNFLRHRWYCEPGGKLTLSHLDYLLTLILLS